MIDDAGDLVLPDPTAPQDTALANGNSYYVIVSSYYYPDDDGSNRADRWDVYHTDTGVDPNPATDSPTTLTMREIASEERLMQSLGPFAPGDDVRVIVRVRRSSDDADDGERRNSIRRRCA